MSTAIRWKTSAPASPQMIWLWREYDSSRTSRVTKCMLPIKLNRHSRVDLHGKRSERERRHLLATGLLWRNTLAHFGLLAKECLDSSVSTSRQCPDDLAPLLAECVAPLPNEVS